MLKKCTAPETASRMLANGPQCCVSLEQNWYWSTHPSGDAGSRGRYIAVGSTSLLVDVKIFDRVGDTRYHSSVEGATCITPSPDKKISTTSPSSLNIGSIGIKSERGLTFLSSTRYRYGLYAHVSLEVGRPVVKRWSFLIDLLFVASADNVSKPDFNNRVFGLTICRSSQWRMKSQVIKSIHIGTQPIGLQTHSPSLQKGPIRFRSDIG